MTARLTGIISLFAILALAGAPGARTWHVTVDGTGDAPTLKAALDSATAGDTVLVGPGEYVTPGLIMTDGVALVGEFGAAQTRVVPYLPPYDPRPDPYAISCGPLALRTIISGLWFDGWIGGIGSGAVSIGWSNDVRVEYCIFTGNDPAGVDISGGSQVHLHNNTFVGNTKSIVNYSGFGSCIHNIIWDPTQGILGFVPVCNDALQPDYLPLELTSANFFSDPLFCGPNDFRISPDSPCAPGQSPMGSQCDLVGALPVGCTPTPTKQRTWGGLKSIYKK